MERNNLYPVFLKVKQLEILIVGGGYVAEEKLRFLLKSSPDAQVTLVAPFFRPDTYKLINVHRLLRLKDHYHPIHLDGKHLVIAATNDDHVNRQIYRDCRQRNLLVNVADNPPLCDFYLGGIVTKGNVKLAISTNGKSPTTAKRLRQFFEDIIPDDIDQMVLNLNRYRKTLTSSFQNKVERMNELTKVLVENHND